MNEIDKDVADEQVVMTPAPTVYTSKLAVWFDFIKGEIKDSGRVIFTGALNIRLQTELEAYEGFIKTNGQFDRVQITHWRMLEG